MTIEEIKSILETADAEVIGAVISAIGIHIARLAIIWLIIEAIDLLYTSTQYFRCRRHSALLYNEVKELEIQAYIDYIHKTGIDNEKLQTLGLYLYAAEIDKRENRKKSIYTRFKNWINKKREEK